MVNKIHYLKCFIKRCSLVDRRLAWPHCVKAGHRQFCFCVRADGRRLEGGRVGGKTKATSGSDVVNNQPLSRPPTADRRPPMEHLATHRERAYNQVPLVSASSLSRGKPPSSTNLFWRLPRGLPAALRRWTNVLGVVHPRVLPLVCMSETKLSTALRETRGEAERRGEALGPWALQKVPTGVRPGLPSAQLRATNAKRRWQHRGRNGSPGVLRRRALLRSVDVLRRPVNMVKVILSLCEMGFCDRAGNPKPNFRYFQESQQSSIARVSRVLRGLSFCFCLANSKRRCMERCSYILTHSLAMMFAAKFKLGTRAKVFCLAGRNLHTPLSARRSASPRP